MAAQELLIRSQRVVLPDEIRPASIHIREGTIVRIGELNETPPGCWTIELGNAAVLPGLVDTHVHINEPGRADWEGFGTATRAAAAGGITTLVEMPLNSIPPTTTVEALEVKRNAAANRCHVDVGFWGGLVPGNYPELAPLYAAGVFGFKCFLVPSGVEEFPSVTEADLRTTFPRLTALGATLLVHAELPGPLDTALRTLSEPSGDRPESRRYSTYLASRPPEAEHEAIALMIRLCREFGTRVHIVHVSSARALSMLANAQADGLPITAETCPHYLSLSAEAIEDGATEFKCAPPIRDRDNADRLWRGLLEGPIEMIVSDHSPSPPELKCRDSGDFLRAWGGISSLQLGLPIIWTAGRERGISLTDLAHWMSRAPARLAGLDRRKGAIAAGYDGDLVVFDPEGAFRVEPMMLHHRHKLTPYAGRLLSGVVLATFLRGETIYEDGRFPVDPCGRMLQRPVD